MQMNPDIAARQRAFKKWWRKNHHRETAHTWLTKHARRVTTEYNMPPEVFDQVKAIAKRFNMSEYRRITREDAEFLWRITHPIHSERIERLTSTAEHFRQALDNYKAAKESADVSNSIPKHANTSSEKRTHHTSASPS